MTPAKKRNLNILLASVGALAVSFVMGSQVRSTQSLRKIEAVQFGDVSVTSSSLSAPTLSGRVVSVYTESPTGVHTKVFERESPGEGTFVVVPGEVNGTKVRIVVVIDPRE